MLGTTLGSLNTNAQSLHSSSLCTPLSLPWNSDADSHCLRYLSSSRPHTSLHLRSFRRLFISSVSEVNIVELKGECRFTKLISWDPEQENKTRHFTAHLDLVLPSLAAQLVKNSPVIQETEVQSLGHDDPLDEEMATQSSFLAWRIPWTEEPGRLQSVGSQKSQTQHSDYTTLLSGRLLSG